MAEKPENTRRNRLRISIVTAIAAVIGSLLVIGTSILDSIRSFGSDQPPRDVPTEPVENVGESAITTDVEVATQPEPPLPAKRMEMLRGEGYSVVKGHAESMVYEPAELTEEQALIDNPNVRNYIRTREQLLILSEAVSAFPDDPQQIVVDGNRIVLTEKFVIELGADATDTKYSDSDGYVLSVASLNVGDSLLVALDRIRDEAIAVGTTNSLAEFKLEEFPTDRLPGDQNSIAPTTPQGVSVESTTLTTGLIRAPVKESRRLHQSNLSLEWSNPESGVWR